MKYHVQDQLPPARRPIWAFSLIELLVVITIIGVMASLAIPAYQQYTFKSKINLMLGAANSAQAAVQTAYSNSQSLIPLTYAAASTPFTTSADPNIQSIQVDAGVITLTGKPSAFGGKNISIVFTPRVSEGLLLWSCSSSSDAASYISEQCRASTCPAYTDWQGQAIIESNPNFPTNDASSQSEVQRQWEASCQADATASLCANCYNYPATALERHFLQIKLIPDSNTATLECYKQVRSLLPECTP
jgi:type IV pilus assembly protein PilA